ncbi:hypothetical protein GCM10027273_37770 [Nocardioides pakistanensis]
MRARHWRTALSGLVAALGLVVASSSAASAVAEGNIDHAESKDGGLRVLYSLPELAEGVEPDLDSVSVSINDTVLEAVAEPAATADAAEQIRRTAILAIDTSKSMQGDRFTQAKAAAKAFLAAAPKDVHIGIVAFAGQVEVVQPPTLDRGAASSVLDGLELTFQTRLYDGVVTAVEAAGTEGQRSVLVLSDGRDTSATELSEVLEAIDAAELRVDAVALGAAARANAPLFEMAEHSEGHVVEAANPDSLTAVFNDQAAALSRQVLISAPLPVDLAVAEGSLAVSVDAGGESYADRAFVSLGSPDAEPAAAPIAPPRAVAPPTVQISDSMLIGGIVALGLGLLVVLAAALGAFGRRDKSRLDDHINAYTRAGAAAAAARARAAQQHDPARSVAESAVGVAQKALAGNKGFESTLASKLDAAGMSLKPAEWLLVHSGMALVAAVLGFLLSSGGFLIMFLLFAFGLVLPWVYLSHKKGKRLKAFNAQLPETLQLVAGGLSAGLSLAQSLDTVVREGSEPIAGEFRRALVESRLGVQVEDSLDSIAQRMESDDFAWVVMAIRIQREVGGNLAELLLKVAATMREREYLRRQVKSLSAEGVLSGWILGALPPGMLVYLMVTNPSYLGQMLGVPLGWIMLGTAAVLMAIGAFWMSRVVKVEV